MERPDVLFYDAPDSDRPKVGEERFIVEQLLDQLGPIAAWTPSRSMQTQETWGSVA